MNFLPEYFNWHYRKVWPRFFLLWRNVSLFPFYYFSITYHLLTLFTPWKRQRLQFEASFNLTNFLSALSFNLISRCLGTIIRLITILYGFVFMFSFFILGFFPIIIWPFCFFLSLPIYLFGLPPKEKEAEYLFKRAKSDFYRLALLLFQHEEGKFVAIHLGLNQKVILQSLLQAPIAELSFQPNKISDLFRLISAKYLPFISFLEKNNLRKEDVYQCALWYELLQKNKAQPLIFDLERIKKIPGIGVNWSYGYTVEFDKYSEDITKTIPLFPLLVGREKELNDLERILLKSEENNALVVGEPGVARHMLIETLAYRMLAGKCQRVLSRRRILAVDMHALTSARPTVLEVKGLAAEILDEAIASGNIIVYIDEIDKYLSQKEERVDFSDVFTKFAQSSVGLIGITTPLMYHKYIEVNPTLVNLFEKIEMKQPDKETVLKELLVSIVPVLEKKHQIIIIYPAVIKALEDADRYLSSTPYPSKVINLLDETTVYLVTRKNERVMKPAHVDELLSEKIRIPLGEIQKREKEKLANLESLLHQRVINQSAAIKSIASALRRSRMNISSSKKPIGSFLFLGPTGVGKTETAKALASIYYGNEETMLRFDMSQYQRAEGLARLIGSISLNSPGELTSKLRDYPFSLLLLDEFEKSDPEISNLFLTLLDEGYIADHLGKKADARNTIIIATSNAGGEHIRQCINQGIAGPELQKELIEHVQREKIFSPELLNRFDGVIVFSPLSEGNLREVAKLMLNDLNKRLQNQEVSIDITQDLIERLAFIGFDPQFGARAMRRILTEKIEDTVAQKLLKGEVKKGEKIKIEM